MKNYFLIFFLILLYSCSQKSEEIQTKVEGDSLETQMIEAYNAGVEALDMGDALYAAKKFNEAEILFPQSEWAPKSILMAAYAYYTQDYYEDTIIELQRFIKLYPNHKNLSYAYYLLGISFYEQIVDEKKDLQSIVNAKKYFNIVITNFPNSEYAIDSEFKIDLINDILASKEMYLGRYYFQKKKWIPSINRFRTVVDDYDTTIYTEEALHRLVEIYFMLGLNDESEKYAQLLGYNYQSSRWYEKSYSIFNKNYKTPKIKSEKKNNKLLKKIKSLLK